MELKIKEITFPEVIEFNFEELKKEITDRVEMYKNLVYTEDQVKQAKADRANLNKFVKALSDERIKIKKQCLQPYEAFEAKVNELSKIVQEPINLIDVQITDYEKKQKQDKKDAIQEYWESVPHDERLCFEMIFESKWLNASVSMKSIQEAINVAIEKFHSDMDTLSKLHEYSFEAQQAYISTLDVSKALNEANRLSEMAKRKAEHEAEQARIAAEAEAKKQAEREVVKMPDGGVYVQDEDKQGFTYHEAPAPEKQWISFSALLSIEDALALNEFFIGRNIEFKEI